MHSVKFIFIVLALLGLQACGDNDMENQAEELSSDFCNCLEQSKIDNPSAYKAVVIGTNKTLRSHMDSCSNLLKDDLLKEIESYEDKEDQTEFLKLFLKALIDSDCGVHASEAIPFDALNLWYESQNK